MTFNYTYKMRIEQENKRKNFDRTFQRLRSHYENSSKRLRHGFKSTS